MTSMSDRQSKIDSFMESVTNTFIGFTISTCCQFYVMWLYSIPMSNATAMKSVGIFTIISVIRQYIIRRSFNGKTPWQAIKRKFL